MKVSEVVRENPDRFVVALPVKRDGTGRVVSCEVLAACESKRDAFFQQAALDALGIRTFLIPTFERIDSAVQITIEGGCYSSQALLTPADNAKIFRDYWNLG